MEMRTALVTGGSEGIGLAAAERLLAMGYRVAIAARAPAGLATAAARLGGGERVTTLVMDVGDEASMRRALAELAGRWPAVDILVNNAGLVLPAQEFGAESLATLRRSMELNLFSAVFLCQELVPAMRARRWGRIVNVSSTAGLGAPPGLIPYATGKAALAAFTRALAVEIAADGVCVNAVAPGPVATRNWRAAKGEAGARARIRPIPSGRLAEPGDVGAVIGFLASEEAVHVTGQVVAIDGGEQAAGPYTFMWSARREG